MIRPEDPTLAASPVDPDDVPSNPSSTPPIGALIEARMTRRAAVAGLLGGAVAAMAGPLRASRVAAHVAAADTTTLDFEDLARGITENHRVAAGYRADVLIRWGDRVLGDAPPFRPASLDARAQAKQFGYNCDFVAYQPLPYGSNSSTRGLLCVNHEYTSPELMWPETPDGRNLSEAATRVSMAAHGHSVVEIERVGESWQPVARSGYNRRITAETPMRVAGPAAGHPRLRTKADPSGRRVLGTFNNCAGGTTPWGTVLIAEENFNYYFHGDVAAHPEAAALKRYGFGFTLHNWGDHEPRFDLDQEPNEANRFGWVVEYDPYDPFSVPTKRTALGRFKHEGATTVLNHDGRVVVYMGDDQRFDYLYRFVSSGTFDPTNRTANRDLLDDGTLFVARFDADGTLSWLPIVHGTGPLTPANGFESQADVLVEVRRAADLLGATPLDRPEDVEVNPATGRVYAALTNNSRRTPEQVDAANPRAQNVHGHVLELLPPSVDGAPAALEADGAAPDPSRLDHAALGYRWTVLLRGGNPGVPADGALYHEGTGPDGWLTCPDNVAFDARGRLWIATDQGPAQIRNGIADGMRACDLDGPGRALTRFFFACPTGAEMCGPCFTPDGETLFVAVQHPAEGTHLDGRKPSTFDDPSTRWPDFDPALPPRPSVVAITRDGGGPIGG